MSTTEPTLRSDARRTRGRLVEAAERVLIEDPGASVDDMAAAAGVGRATAFRHFPTRDELVAAAWHAAARSAARELDQVELESIDPPAVLGALVAATVHVGQRHPLLIHGARPPAAELAEAFAATDKRLQKAIERAQRAGSVRDDIASSVLVEHLLSLAYAVLAAGLTDEAAVLAAQSLAGDGVRVPSG